VAALPAAGKPSGTTPRVPTSGYSSIAR